MIEELLKEVNTLLDESNELDTVAEKHLANGNKLEWEDSKMESVNKAAYARGIRYALEKLDLVAKMYDREVSYYNVITYKKTIINEYHKEGSKKFTDLEKAVKFGKNEIAKGNKVRIEEISNIVNWN